MQPYNKQSLGGVTYTTVESNSGVRKSYSYDTLNTSQSRQLYNVYSNPSLPYVVKAQDYTLTDFSWHQGTHGTSFYHPYGYQISTMTGYTGRMPTIKPLGDGNNAYNNALSELSSVVRGNIDLSIDAFQAKMTVKLARNILSMRKQAEKVVLHLLAATTVTKIPIKRVPVKGTRAYYRKKFRKSLRDKRSTHERIDNLTRRPMKDVGSAWLQFTYGLKPTLQTIYDLINQENVRCGNDLIVRKKLENGYRKHVRGATKYEANAVDTTDPNRTVYAKLKSQYLVEIGGRYRPGTTYIESLSRVTSLNPASIAWELMPFSFVIDWFLDIGGYLRNMETALLSNLLGNFEGYVTFLEIHRTTETTSGNGLSANGYTYFGETKGAGRQVSKRRVRLHTFPLPRPPRFKADLGSGRMLNAAALLTTLIGRKK